MLKYETQHYHTSHNVNKTAELDMGPCEMLLLGIINWLIYMYGFIKDMPSYYSVVVGGGASPLTQQLPVMSPLLTPAVTTTHPAGGDAFGGGL